MSSLIKSLRREWAFMCRQRYILLLLLCSIVVSGFAVVSGINEVNEQHATIERLKVADEIDRQDAQHKHDDFGMLAYYTFHLTYLPPSNLAFAALGERDVFPWKHRVRMLALEGQIYESDTSNAELAQIGKFDFVFVISALAPLFIILLFHDLFANERANGRFDLLVTTAHSPISLWGARSIVRFGSLFVGLLLPFWIGANISGTAATDVFIVTFACFVYLVLWTLLSIWWGRNATNSPWVASGLMGVWVLFAFIIPILGDLAINQSTHAPKGGDIVMVQREAVNDAWDLPVTTTMDAFVATHPQWQDYTETNSMFEWKWYYAFQQVGDQKAAPLAQAYQQAAKNKYDLAGFVSLLSPPLLLQRVLTRAANTDALAAFEYETQIRKFHEQLRHFYYPPLFKMHELEASQSGDKELKQRLLDTMPKFEDVMQGQVSKTDTVSNTN
ncbi:MAG: DUF3526 domain-containing protein [Paraglaciecola sp.]|uniref:DUF3526 domain-containing protein n=1 Tax=Paraglaciecola sp. TaxID=1920173 RepID=UPI0032969461